MQRIAQRVARVLILLAILGGAAVAATYALAIGSLSSRGPNPDGYGLLAIANHGAPVAAGLVVLAVLAAVPGRRSLVPAAILALSSGVVGGLALATWSIGHALSHVDQHAQPPALNSLILAITGSAVDVSPAAVVLAVGALALIVIRSLRRFRRWSMPVEVAAAAS
ncbi:hypothetical protein GCM10027515_22900 [Schumannella luteola]|uniref:Amino acid transporter n=1 Tax=Schumannella luteola TaxID=472059 RepID=A0A852YF42_9MICO|nr:hypothetical protein [Schumannella luteola]NYG99914.1 amino acid transporter [Schumannella luteola]TPW90510.1 hypothetical protein FJ656_37050 [Schumannella luteola]